MCSAMKVAALQFGHYAIGVRPSHIVKTIVISHGNQLILIILMEKICEIRFPSLNAYC